MAGSWFFFANINICTTKLLTTETGIGILDAR